MSSPVHTFIVCLKGTTKALHHAYRRSLRMLAEFDLNFPNETNPGYVRFEWNDIAGYRVMAVVSDGMGYNCDFSDIPGLEEYVWVLRNTDAMLALSNDRSSVILSHKAVFGIPEAEYEIV